MSSIREKEFTIKGITPYFFTKFSNDKTPKTKEEEMKVANNRVYKTEDGNLFIPSRQIKKTIYNSASITKTKIEKSNKRLLDLINALVQIEPIEIPIIGYNKIIISTKDLNFIEIPTKTAGFGGKQETMRPVLNVYINPGWELTFTIKTHQMLEMSILETCLLNAGFLCGIGGRRSDNGGRFEVV
jgi:hypothetical protein